MYFHLLNQLNYIMFLFQFIIHLNLIYINYLLIFILIIIIKYY